jgi:hypothetical protein
VFVHGQHNRAGLRRSMSMTSRDLPSGRGGRRRERGALLDPARADYWISGQQQTGKFASAGYFPKGTSETNNDK